MLVEWAISFIINSYTFCLYVEYLNMPEEKRKDIRTLIGAEPEEAGYISSAKAGFNNFKGKLSFQDSTDKDKKRDFGDVIKKVILMIHF